MPVSKSKGGFRVTAYAGDAKTLLAFNLPAKKAKRLAGFTIQVKPGTRSPYYIFNTLQFAKPGAHAQNSSQPANSSINAPIHKFRWVHVPGSAHQGRQPFLGKYTYTVTPRYFNEQASMMPIDPTLSVSVELDVVPFRKGSIELGFTRGFTQSQGFVRQFGKTAPIRPRNDELLFDTAATAGRNSEGEAFTFADEYEWSGFTARDKVFELLDGVLKNRSLQLDMFAYDLNEPDVLGRLLTLAAQGRVRLILDNAALHHNTKGSKPEDEFTELFNQKKKSAAEIRRGHFSSYAHDKVLIVKNARGAVKVLTGSTNFSVTGMYVNSNHVLVFNDRAVAGKYEEVFEAAWAGNVRTAPFRKSPLSQQNFAFSSPKMKISFAPHDPAFAQQLLGDLARRVKAESTKGKAVGSVMFAVMDLGAGAGPVRPALIGLHNDEKIFSYGISDSAVGIRLYAPKHKTGVLVTGKPTATRLPPPFNQVPGVGLGHQVHHKFVVCGFNTKDAVLYCGSSNLAEGGEEKNGDNLLEIHDRDVATAFAIEAMGLVDHFEFLDRYSGKAKTKKVPASKEHAAVEAGWFLSTTDAWTKPYFDRNDLRFMDRELFG